MGAGIETQVLQKGSKHCQPPVISPAPVITFILFSFKLVNKKDALIWLLVLFCKGKYRDLWKEVFSENALNIKANLWLFFFFRMLGSYDALQKKYVSLSLSLLSFPRATTGVVK